MTAEPDAHVAVIRRQWDERLSAWFERYARSRWAAAEPYWQYGASQSRLPVLPAELPGAAVVELGCGSGVARLCMPEQGPATDRLVRDLFGLHHVVRRGTSGTAYGLVALPHGEWIRLMARFGLAVEDLIEIQVPPDAANNDFPEFPGEWVRRWPAEEIWFARR